MEELLLRLMFIALGPLSLEISQRRAGTLSSTQDNSARKPNPFWDRNGFFTFWHAFWCIFLSCLSVAVFAAFSLWVFFCRENLPQWAPVLSAIVAVLWAVGAPSWFWIERSQWRTDKSSGKDRSEVLDKNQERVRDFWIGLGAVVIIVADHVVFPHH